VKNSRVTELHNTCHYVFIVDEALVVRETRKFCLMNEGAYAWINWPLTPALLRLHPMFEPLRNDARCQKLVAATSSLKNLATVHPTV
jgi:hypothetical protein